jgi:hypothetical protein
MQLVKGLAVATTFLHISCATSQDDAALHDEVSRLQLPPSVHIEADGILDDDGHFTDDESEFDEVSRLQLSMTVRGENFRASKLFEVDADSIESDEVSRLQVGRPTVRDSFEAIV